MFSACEFEIKPADRDDCSKVDHDDANIDKDTATDIDYNNTQYLD